MNDLWFFIIFIIFISGGSCSLAGTWWSKNKKKKRETETEKHQRSKQQTQPSQLTALLSLPEYDRVSNPQDVKTFAKENGGAFA